METCIAATCADSDIDTKCHDPECWIYPVEDDDSIGADGAHTSSRGPEAQREEVSEKHHRSAKNYREHRNQRNQRKVKNA